MDSSDTVTAAEVVASLIKNGGCVVRGILNFEQLALIEKDVRPWIEKDRPWVGEFFPPETRRVMGLVEKSKLFTELIPGNRLYRDVCDILLTSTHKSWLGQKLETSVSHPQLNNTIVFSIGPGARRQELHRDDMMFHNELTELASHADYKIGRDTNIGFFVAGKETTRANGATRFIPRSHLWAKTTPPNEDLAYYAELKPGDGFLMLASCFHGGSANTTVDQERLVYSCFMTKGFLRQEENQYLANSLESVKRYSVDMQKMIGYSLSSPFGGWVDLKDPRVLLLDPGEDIEGDLF
ncbi:phytanoyl-CoA dioxygenase family protein [Aspergillus aculeatinus CBS 121060]|uniref:Phytanoyl-CoA dioxygenase family protein n=1 Tax=Aspergillus aculeatinus CBS 121060 TaxID=1448322 RepID=A0ACD1HCP8_9EURO|nr:phytanoyl-CoA dioxygenase family protein [Aspergillus aculeatinus CBS 121060]RAH71416.1 phytanoyl-CoA dioxygenase family protein [Aspergillus aculeatinus CBS 121060]